MSALASLSSWPVPLHALRSSPVTAMAPATWSFFIDVTLFCVRPGLAGGRELEGCERCFAHLRPPGGDHLGAGVERHTLGAVHVLVAEEGVLPAAEGVVGHRDGDRDVDADHPHLDAALEPPRGLAA